MRTNVLTTLVVLSLGFFSQASAGVINRRDDVDPNAAPEDLTVPQGDAVDELAQEALDNLLAANLIEDGTSTTEKRTTPRCSLMNLGIRREWGSLSKNERKAYTDAVLCLTKKPSQSDPTLVPGARTRYDDFVAVHIQQTLTIHGTANFLAWHRYFTWTFEQALRNECGYQGYQPYWNWAKYSQNPEASPIFDGSAYSMSGNGAYVPGRSNALVGGGAISIPPGNGGGCLTNGPFKDMVVNLGPLSATIQGINPNPLPSGLGYNPRCIRRDIGNYVSTHWNRLEDTLSLLSQPNIKTFQERMQGDFPNGFLGVHSAGHFTIAGDPGGDLFASPGDPAFFLHHGMIDRSWWIWQNLDIANRVQTIAGTITINNRPESRDGVLSDTINLGVLAPENVTLDKLMSTVDWKYCYIYL